MPGRNPQLDALGEALGQLRKERGLSRPRLAMVAGLDEDLLDAIEQGLHDPAYDVLLTLADALGVTPGALFVRAEGTHP